MFWASFSDDDTVAPVTGAIAVPSSSSSLEEGFHRISATGLIVGCVVYLDWRTSVEFVVEPPIPFVAILVDGDEVSSLFFSECAFSKAFKK